MCSQPSCMQHTNTMGAPEIFSHSKLEHEFTELQLLLTGS